MYTQVYATCIPSLDNHRKRRLINCFDYSLILKGSNLFIIVIYCSQFCPGRAGERNIDHCMFYLVFALLYYDVEELRLVYIQFASR